MRFSRGDAVVAGTIALAMVVTALVLSWAASAKRLAGEVTAVATGPLTHPFEGVRREGRPSWVPAPTGEEAAGSARLDRVAKALSASPAPPAAMLFHPDAVRGKEELVLEAGRALGKIFPPGNALPSAKLLSPPAEGDTESLLRRSAFVLTARLHLLLVREAPAEERGDAFESCLNMAWTLGGGVAGADPWSTGHLAVELRQAALRAIESAWSRSDWKEATLERLSSALRSQLARPLVLPGLMELDRRWWKARIAALGDGGGVAGSAFLVSVDEAESQVDAYFDPRLVAMKGTDVPLALAALDRLDGTSPLLETRAAPALLGALPRDWAALRRAHEACALREELAVLALELEKARLSSPSPPDRAWARARAGELGFVRLLPSRIEYDARGRHLRLSAAWSPLGPVPLSFDGLLWRSAP